MHANMCGVVGGAVRVGRIVHRWVGDSSGRVCVCVCVWWVGVAGLVGEG